MGDDAVIDTHQHIWDPTRAEYAWLTDDLGPICRAFDFDELRPHLDQAGITATVQVQSADNLDDTRLMLDCASTEPRVVGVVAWAPLDRVAETAPLLEQYRENRAIVGIRTLIHTQPDPYWLRRDDVLAGLAELERSGLAFDVVATRPEHLECAVELGHRYPALPIVLDHLAHPPIGDDADDRWWDLFAEVARNPRATAKVSGLYPAGDPNGTARTDRIRPVFEYALQHFGADRLMYGGDWPISVLHGDYGTTWASLHPLLEELSETERAALRRGTAERFYALDEGRLRAAGV